MATAITESSLGSFHRWAACLALQDTELLWDLLLADASDRPSAQHLDWLTHWSHSRPFGPLHRIRTARWWPEATDSAWALIGGKFERWASYEYLLALRSDVLMPTDTLQRLYAQDTARANGVAGCVLLRGVEVRAHPETFMEVRSWLFS